MAKSARPRTQDVEPPWKKALDQNVRFLQENLLLTESFLGYLVQEKILTVEMIDRIKTSSDSEHGRTIELVKCLKTRSEDCFAKFLDVLHATGNKFVAEYLELSIPPPSRISSRESHGCDVENMSNVRHLLVERMDPDFGLLDKLLQLRALTYPESGRIKSEKSIFDRNEQLLELIFKKMKHQALLTALTETGQKHLFNLVTGNGGYRPEYGTVWPLREREIDILDLNRLNLVDVIDPCDLITRLFSKSVISDRQQRYINSLHNNTDKAETLLDILRRGSEDYYHKTILCLHESNQSNVAELLVNGGVLAQVHVSNEGETEQVNEEEDHVLEAFKALLQNTTSPQLQRMRELLDLQIMRAKKGHSIVFYIYCKTLDELLYLYELLINGEFKKRIATVFDLLISKRVTTVSAVNWSEEEFTRLKTYFKEPSKKIEAVEERRGDEDVRSQKSLEAEGHSSDEMDLLLQTKDQQILELEAKLIAKDRRIKELESVADELKSRADKTLPVLPEKMQTSERCKNCVFYDEIRSVNDTQLEINEKDEQLKEAEEKVKKLKSRVEELQEELEYFREYLKTREDELNVVLENERRMKRKLGLDEDSTDGELMEHLRESFNTRSELKRAQDELGNITREKMALDDRLTSLAHQNNSLQFELRQKKIEIQRIRRGSLDSALSKRKSVSADPRRQVGLLELTQTLPGIDVSSYPQLPEPDTPLPSIPTLSNLPAARVPSAVAQDIQLPKLQRRRTFLSIEDRETKYCVICRRNYYLKSECRIHVEPIVSGRFSCCGADANLKYVGCKMVNHLYIYFTGLGNEYVFYDERGRPLDFKDQ